MHNVFSRVKNKCASAFGRDEVLLIRGTGFLFGSKANADKRELIPTGFQFFIEADSNVFGANRWLL